ncbi:MAG: hypothetical protein KGI33_09010, partial [Thaumarchaeota archaeon]|nr:hypothetical protein [Nitrososphaerota archaeon]
MTLVVQAIVQVRLQLKVVMPPLMVMLSVMSQLVVAALAKILNLFLIPVITLVDSLVSVMMLHTQDMCPHQLIMLHRPHQLIMLHRPHQLIML